MAATFTLQTEGGPLTFAVESYTLDLDQQFLDVRGARVKDADGRLLFQAASAQASFRTEGFQLAGAKVKLRDGSMLIERLADGQLAVQRYLPPPTDEPAPQQGFTVDAFNFELHYLDQTGTDEVRQLIFVESLAVDAFGDYLAATVRARPDQGGVIAGHLTRAESGDITFAGRLETIDPMALLDRLRPIREVAEVAELRRVTGQGWDMTGAVELSIPVDRPVTFRFDGAANAREAGYEAYRFRDVAFEGRVTEGGLVGRMRGSAPSLSARFDGGFHWSNGVTGQGDLDAVLNDTSTAPGWLSALLPADVAASQASFRGWVGVRPAGVSASGPVAAAELQVQDYALSDVSAELALSPQAARLDDLRLTYRDETINGTGAIDLVDQSLSGVFRGQSVDFVRFLDDPRLKGADLRGDITVALTGTVAEPDVALRARGDARVPIREDLVIPVTWDADARYRDDRLTVNSLLIEGAEGAAVASGWWNTQSNEVLGEVVAKGLDLETLDTQVAGTIYVTAAVTGTLSDPKYEGRAEAYAVKVPEFEFPIAASNFSGDLVSVTLTDALVAKGASKLTGEGSYRFDDEAIEGAFAVSTIQLSDWLQNGPTGILDLMDGTFSGTLTQPIARARFESSRLIYGDYAVDAVVGDIALNGKTLSATSVEILDNRGVVRLEGEYDLDRRTGYVEGAVENVSVTDLVPESFTDVLLFGSVGGLFNVGINADNEVSGVLELAIWKFGVNEAVVGAGTMTVFLAKNTVDAEGRIGSEDRYLALESFRYGVDDGYFDASIVAEKLPIPELTPALRRYLNPEDLDTRSRLAALEGALDLDIRVVGTADDFVARLEGATIEEVRFEGVDLGRLSVSGAYAGKTFELEDFDWASERGSMRVKRRRMDAGDVLDGEITDFDASNFGLVNRDLSGWKGRFDASFLVADPETSPVIRASITSTSVEVNSDATVSDLNLYDILIREGEARIDGGFVYRGFRGTVSAQAPFRYPFAIPEDEPLSAVIRLPERPLAELVELLPTLDPQTTVGQVSGEFRVSGPLNNLVAGGQARIVGDVVRLKSQRDGYRNVRLSANYADDAVVISGGAENEVGGSAALSGRATLPTLRTILEEGPDRLLASMLNASLNFDRFSLNESFGIGGEFRGVLSGRVDATGVARAPSVTGRLSVDEGFVTVPQPEEAGGPREPSDFNPSLDIRIETANPMRVGAAIATIDLRGVAALGGTFNVPVVTANLETAGGTIRLPLARVQVTPGGTVRFVYQGEADGFASQRLDVDIDGTTRITAVPYAGLVQRYTVFVNLRGSLLEEGGLIIRAYSDPPDLSQARILSLIGYGDLFGDTGNAEATGLEARLRQAATSIAIPALFDPVAEQIAKGLGLDFVGADYNAIDGASIIVAKSFGAGFSLQASRQLFEPAFGPTKYDLRLQYRIPVKGIPGALSFSFGTDQERPWKISVDYSFRF